MRLELPLEVLFEKLVEYYSEEENLSAQAYNILDTLSKDDQADAYHPELHR